MDLDETRDIRRALSENWGVEAMTDEPSDRDALLEALARRVDFLLAHDYERLLQGMYLIDVPEERFNEAMDPAGTDIPPRAIAKLILQRELEKLASRRRYGQADSPSENSTLNDQPRLESGDES